MIDKLKAFRGKDYKLNQKITIRQPTLDEICEYGEQEYFSLVKLFCSTPADQKVDIWDMLHIYWDQMDEFELFISIMPAIMEKDLSIIIPNVDFTSFVPVVNQEVNEIVLKNQDGVVIDRAVHLLMTDYVRYVHRFRKNVDVGYDNFTKDVMIEDDRDEMAVLARKPFESFIFPAISALTNCADFKYRFDDVWGLPIGAFMVSVERIPRYRNYEHMMHGIYSGCVDMKKINKKDLIFMSELK